MNPDIQKLIEAVDHLAQAQTRGWLDYTNAAVLALTLAALIVYTRETYHLRRETQKQALNATMPLVVLLITSLDNAFNGRLVLDTQRIQNIGHGAAFNIQVSSIKKRTFDVEFTPVALLDSQSHIVLNYTIAQDQTYNGLSNKPMLLEYVLEHLLGDDLEVSVDYSDSVGTRYRSEHIVKFDKSGVVTTEFQKWRFVK